MLKFLLTMWICWGKNELKCNVINIKGECLYKDKDNLQVHVEKHEN